MISHLLIIAGLIMIVALLPYSNRYLANRRMMVAMLGPWLVDVRLCSFLILGVTCPDM